MSAAKIDREELEKRLKEDELAVYFGTMKDQGRVLMAQHGRTVAIVLGLLILGIVAIYLWNVQSQTGYRESQMLFGNATAFVQQQKYEEALGQLNQLVEKYSGSEVIPAARTLRGDCYFQTKQYPQALEEYRAALTQMQGEDAVPVRLAIVQTLRSDAKFDEAIQELDSLAQTAGSDALKEQILYLKGSTYEDLNDKAKAIETYKSIPKTSAWYNMALGRIDWLEAEPVQAINSK